MGAKTSKRYSFLKSLLNLFNLFLNFLLSCSHQIAVLDSWNFEFPIFNESLNFTIVPYGETKNSIIWKTRDRRAKRSEIWVSRVSMQRTQGTIDTYVIKVILGSFTPNDPDFRKTWFSKTVGHRAKRNENLASGVSIQCTQGTFDT